MGKIREGVTEFVPVRVSAILHGCRACGQPVPVNGLVDRTTCPHCQGSVTVPTRLWQRALRAVNVSALVDGDGQHILDRHEEIKDATADRKLVLQRRIAAAPTCLGCGGALPMDGAGWREPEVALVCGSCGVTTRFGPPGLDLGEGTVPLTHVAAPEGGEGPDDAADVTAGDGLAPIAMSCPSCAAGLSISVADQRTTTCGYCQASVYIPDDLWRQLHPVKKAAAWNAIFQLTPDALRAAGTGNVGCVLALMLLFFGGLFAGLTAGFVGSISQGQIVPAVVCGVLLLGFGAVALWVIVATVMSAFRYRRLATRLERAASG